MANLDFIELLRMVTELQKCKHHPRLIVPTRCVGLSSYVVCSGAIREAEQDRRKAALAALRAGFVPVPVCPRFEEATVDLDEWHANLSATRVRRYWTQHPDDAIGFMLEREKDDADDSSS